MNESHDLKLSRQTEAPFTDGASHTHFQGQGNTEFRLNLMPQNEWQPNSINQNPSTQQKYHKTYTDFPQAVAPTNRGQPQANSGTNRESPVYNKVKGPVPMIQKMVN